MLINIFFNKIIPYSLKKDALAYSGAKNILSCVLIGCIAAPSYAFIYYILNFHSAALVIFLTWVVMSSSAFMIHYSASLFWARQLIISALFFCLVWLSYSLGGIYSSATFWFVLPPLIAVFLGSIIDGIFWGTLCTLMVFILFCFEYFYIPLPITPISNVLILQMLSLSGLIIIILGLVYLFERGRRIATQEIQATYHELLATRDAAEYLAKKAETASRLKSEFVANMSHELRTPLNGIIGFTDVILTGTAGPISAEQNEYLNDVATSAHHLLQLINNILDLSKIESGKLVLHPEPVNLNATILEVKASLNILLRSKHLQFNLEIEPSIVNVILDPQKFKQIIYNYLSNAIKFSHEGGKIKITVSAYGSQQFKLAVEDNGIGIKAEDIPELFAPFKQLDSSFSKKYQGTGLGLALTRRLAELQGGEVGVKSGLGKGSTFYAILPCYPPDH